MGDDWGSLGLDGGRTRLPSETISAPAALLPATATGSVGVASPVAADGVLVIAGLDGKVRAYRESDRSWIWTAATDGQIMATPAIDRGRVYVPSTNGTLYAFRLADGVLLGTVATGGADQSSPVVAGSTLFMASGFPNTSAMAIDTAGGSIAWQTDLEQVSNSSPALASGKLIAACNSGKVYALDQGTGGELWTYPAGGTFGHSSPMVDGNSVFLVSDATFHRVDLASGTGTNWSIPLVDPAPPASPLGLDWAASSPVKAGTLVVVLVRFNYHLDQNGDYYADARKLREFAFAIDPATQKVSWTAFLGEINTPDLNGIPPYQLCPSPVATGTGVACASSVSSALRILSLANGAVSASFPLDAPCLASPLVTNARLYALSRAGTLYAYEDPGHVQPAAVTGLAPAGIELDATPATLQWTASAPGSTYLVRLARDGEILMNWDYETTVSTASIDCPALDEIGVTYTWAVRVRDSAGAYGPWTQASFSINLPPEPVSGLTAVPKHGKVILNWTPSPTPNATSVMLAYGPTAGSPGAPVNLGNVTTTTITGLTNGTEYTFVLRVLDSDNDLSAPVSIACTPVQLITVGGIGFDTLDAAAAAAGRDQTIQLGEDTFLLDRTLDLRRGVSLAGVNAHVTRIEAAGRFVMVSASGHQSIRLVTLANGSTGVDARGAGTIIRNCVIRGMTEDGLLIHGAADVINNTIVRNGLAGVRSLGSAEARNNIVQDNGVGLSGHLSSRYNDVSDGYSGLLPGPGDLRSPVLFLDEATGDYREAPFQPSLDAGNPQDDYGNEPSPNGGRINMGAFGNTSLAASSANVTSSGGGGSCAASVSVLPPASAGVAALALLILLVLGRVLDLGRWISTVDRR
jgi:outer membrane protein assembly factor BamB